MDILQSALVKNRTTKSFTEKGINLHIEFLGYFESGIALREEILYTLSGVSLLLS